MADRPVHCDGTLIWHDVAGDEARGWPASAVLECSACDYLVCAGNYHDRAHRRCEMIRGAV